MRSSVERRTRASPYVSPDPSSAPDEGLLDLRFAALLPARDWARLDPAVRRRFSRRLSGGATAVYVGEVVEVWASPLGRLLAWAAGLIGDPLPRVAPTPTPSVVMVTEDGVGGGQVWTRLYARARGFPQRVCSAKRFAGPTGLEEHVGGGVGMALAVSVEARDAAPDHAEALTFRSAGYFVQLFGLRLRLPGWAEPGRLTVEHVELGGGRFAFTLDLHHPAFGRLIRQRAVYQERSP